MRTIMCGAAQRLDLVDQVADAIAAAVKVS